MVIKEDYLQKIARGIAADKPVADRIRRENRLPRRNPFEGFEDPPQPPQPPLGDGAEQISMASDKVTPPMPDFQMPSGYSLAKFKQSMGAPLSPSELEMLESVDQREPVSMVSGKQTAPYQFKSPVGELRPATMIYSKGRTSIPAEGKSMLEHRELINKGFKLIQEPPTKEPALTRIPFTKPSEDKREIKGYYTAIMTGERKPLYEKPRGLEKIEQPLYEPIGESGVAPADILGTVGLIGALAYGGYVGVKSLIPVTKELGNKALQQALNTGLDKWIAQRSRGIPPQHLKRFQDALYNVIAKDKTWLQQRATENMLARMGRNVNPAQAARQAANDTINDIEIRLTALVPKFTPGGSAVPGQTRPLADIMAAGTARLGKPAEVITRLPTEAATQALNSAKVVAANAGLDLEAVQGISEGEYWVSLTTTKLTGSDAFNDWVFKLIEKDSEKGSAIKKLLQGKFEQKDFSREDEGYGRKRFLPFKSVEDAQKFIQTGDTSLISKEISLKGQPWSPEKVQATREEMGKMKPTSELAAMLPTRVPEVAKPKIIAKTPKPTAPKIYGGEARKTPAQIREEERVAKQIEEDSKAFQVAAGRAELGAEGGLSVERHLAQLNRYYADLQASLPTLKGVELTKAENELSVTSKRIRDLQAGQVAPTEVPPAITPQLSPEAVQAPMSAVEAGGGGLQPSVPPEAPVAPPAQPPAATPAEDLAVTEVAGAPPKPPKDWDKIGKGLYDRFKKQASKPTPSTVPLSDRILQAWGKVEKFSNDELARLNWLGWQAELDLAMVRASSGQSGQLYRKTMQNVTKSLGGDSDLISYVDDYLLLRHQLEVLKATGRESFTITRGGTEQRFTAKQIGLLFRQMSKELGGVKYASVKEAASHIPAVYNQILRGSQELTPEQIEGLIKKYPWYNPMLFESETTPVNITRRLTPRQIKQLTKLESDKELVSPLMSLPTTINRRMQAIAINDARKSVADVAIDPKNKAVIGGDVEIVATKPEGAFIDYFENGQRKYLKLGKGAEWMAKDIELIQTQPTAPVIRIVRSLQNVSKAFFTTYNPGFMAWNTMFDGMVSYFSEGISPLAFSKSLAGNIKAIFKDVPSVDEFRRAGGEMMGYFGKNVEEMGGTQIPGGFVSKKGGQLVLKNPKELKRLINPFELIRELGLAGENAGRRAVFDKAIKEGLPPKEAALRGRRATVDFSRFSSASKHINNWFLYFNPALQGFLLPGRAIAKDPRSLWRLATMVIGYAALTVYNQSYDEYQDVSDRDKVGKLLIMLPSDEYNKYGKKVPHYLTLLPFREFAIFTAPIEYLLGRLKTEEPEAYRSIGQELGELYPIVSPLSMISETSGIAMPTQLASTVQQIVRNHDDYRNKPIVDDEMALLDAPDQYDQYTDRMAIRIGQALNMSPKKLDFFVSNMFGDLGGEGLRIIDSAIREIDEELVDERIAGLTNELRSIAGTVPPDRIEVTRETFLEGLSVEDRQLVLDMERLPEDRIPIIAGIVNRFYKDYGGQVYKTAKEKALANRSLDDYPPEALEALQKSSNENASNLISRKISKAQYDDNRTRYRAYFSGGGSSQWREAMTEGAVSRTDVDKYMPEAYQRSGEFQAVSAYTDIRGGYIEDAGGVFDSDTWDAIERKTLADMRQYYSEQEIQYAILHKDDWIDNLPEPARTVERRRAIAIADGTWWDGYQDSMNEPSDIFKRPEGRRNPFESGGGSARRNPFE